MAALIRVLPPSLALPARGREPEEDNGDRWRINELFKPLRPGEYNPRRYLRALPKSRRPCSKNLSRFPPENGRAFCYGADACAKSARGDCSLITRSVRLSAFSPSEELHAGSFSASPRLCEKLLKRTLAEAQRGLAARYSRINDEYCAF